MQVALSEYLYVKYMHAYTLMKLCILQTDLGSHAVLSK